MFKWLAIIAATLRSTLHRQRDLAVENLVLRQQLAILKQRNPRPRLTDTDRLFWVLFSRVWPGWREALHIVRPETVVRWHRLPPGQTLRTFLQNHAQERIALDFFTVPTATFRVLFVLVILSHDRRRILHFNVTEHPTAKWTARQLLDAYETNDSPLFLVRDRDAIYGEKFRRQVASLKIQEILTAPRSPW